MKWHLLVIKKNTDSYMTGKTDPLGGWYSEGIMGFVRIEDMIDFSR